MNIRSRISGLIQVLQNVGQRIQGKGYQWSSVDTKYWEHPFVSRENLANYRAYSEMIWSAASDHLSDRKKGLKVAFCGNMAQNMYNWARIANRLGADAHLFLNPQDLTAISRPEWEEFEGDWSEIYNGEGFVAANPGIPLQTPCHIYPSDAEELRLAWKDNKHGNRRPLLKLVHSWQGLRPELFFHYNGLAPYWEWAKALVRFDVCYAASNPIPAYLSGRPYCASATGGDLMYDCGRSDDYGMAMSMSFSAARFLIHSNAPLGHFRRLGFSNAVFLPYPIDTIKYSPGEGCARREWKSRFGEGFYVLITARLDDQVKGLDRAFRKSLAMLARKHSRIKFVLLSWGEDKDTARNHLQETGLQDSFIFLSPVGKRKLIDYYRSCDCVLDQLVYGYFGASGLEAMAAGKPVVMRLREEHYRPLYKGDLPPVMNSNSPNEVVTNIEKLYLNGPFASELGKRTREWLERNHGHEIWGPKLLGLLALTADGVELQDHVETPLQQPLSEEEHEYHASCLVHEPQ